MLPEGGSKMFSESMGGIFPEDGVFKDGDNIFFLKTETVCSPKAASSPNIPKCK
jgi:hypothetical protein